jgi:hypothetical protein
VVTLGADAVVARRPRLVVAMLLGLVAGDFARDAATTTGVPPDLLQFWYAARVLLQGGDPYAVIGPGLAFDYPYPLVYPLHASVAFLPLAPLPAAWAHAVVMGLGVFAFSWALMEHGWPSLLALLSVCVWHAVGVGQWSPLLAASLVVPPIAFLLTVKPTIGLALWAARPSWWAVIGAAVLTAVAFALDPGWVGQWRDAVGRAVAQAKHTFPYRAPVVMPGGVLILAALARWRRMDARLLVALACVPHTTLPYEMVPLFLIPRGWAQSVSLVAASMAMWWLVSLSLPHSDFYATVLDYTRTAVPLMYLPCTLMVLRRANEGPLPDWLERRLATAPEWLRGRSVGRSA